VPIALNPIERFAAVRLSWAPGPLLDVLGAMGFWAVTAGVRLGLFEALNDGPATSAELARRIGADARGAQILLDALQVLGYVKRRGDRYESARMARRWFSDEGGADFAPTFEFFHEVLPTLWKRLDESVREGAPPEHFYTWLDSHQQAADDFQRMTLAVARIAGREVLARVKVAPHEQRLLDLGGGHGQYAIDFCRRHPRLRAQVMDLRAALEVGRANVDAAGMSDRIDLVEGDFWTAELGEGYDVVLLFNVLHAYSSADTVELLRRVARSLRPGGRVVVMDQMPGGLGAVTPVARAIDRMLGLNYFHLVGGQLHSWPELRGSLRAAGFRRVRRMPLRTALGSSIAQGTR